MKTSLHRCSMKTFEIILIGFLFSVVVVSCSSSSSGTPEPTIQEDGSPQPEPGEARPPNVSLFKVYSETGETGMRVTYSPASLTLLTDVVEIEGLYQEVMSCVGMVTEAAPNIYYTDNEAIFPEREDGVEVNGFYDIETSAITVLSDDLDISLGNRLYWTRHGMIEYLIDMQGLKPNSPVSPFLDCHFPNAK